MRRFGRVFCWLAFLALAGTLGAPPAAGQVEQISFDPPQDGTTWHRGDVVKARIVPTAPIPASGSHPVLELVIGENTREVEGRLYQNGNRARFYYTVQRDDAASPDHVRMAKVSLGGFEVDLSGFTPTGGPYEVDGSSAGEAPVIDGIGLSSFFVPPLNVYRPGDEIYWYVRFHKDVTVGGSPVLMQRIGDELREARYRPDVQTLGHSVLYFTYTVQDGDCDMDGVGLPANAVRGGSIRERDGSRPADTSHPEQDPARDLQADAIRTVACAAVPAAPAPWLALLASLLLASGAHLVRQRRLA